MKIAVVGTGYVGLSNAILLAQNNEVVALDIIPEKIELINGKTSPIADADMSSFFKAGHLIFELPWINMMHFQMQSL